MLSLRNPGGVLLLLSAAFGSSLAQTPAYLPIVLPNGYNTTFATAKLVDSNRNDPFAEIPEPRAVMISLFRPADCQATELADYTPPATADFSNQFLGLPNGTFELFKLQVCESEAPTYPTSPESDFPVVLFSPGFGGLRPWYNGLAQWVASQGYTVVTMDHTYDSSIVEFPDGSVAYSVFDMWNSTDEEIEGAVQARVDDAKFVLDQMANASVISELIPGANKGLDVKQAGMFGHSLGGATTANTMLIDPRLKGGVNMDGAMHGPARYEEQDRPFEILATSTHNRTSDPSWEDFYSSLQGWKRGFIYEGATHQTFSDGPFMVDLVGADPGDLPPNFQMGDVEGLRNFGLLSDYIGSFFDFVLKGEGQGVPMEAYPEISTDGF
ncbi:hypothetical protein FQN54_008891 [Arachnomyces sp. PD_36]|nr:hypothetical protein FQN54_008891 [Arachnomyces sp. PD_36]